MFLLMSCGNDKNSGSLKTTHKYLNEYLLTRDKKFLKKGYDQLNRNVGFNEKGITDKNREIVIPLLMYLRKYDELEKLMINYKTIDINKKEGTYPFNGIFFLIYYICFFDFSIYLMELNLTT